MMRLIKKFSVNLILPVTWTVFIIVLLCVPGSAFSDLDSFDFPHLDKLIHIVLFAVLLLFWGYYYRHRLEWVAWQRALIKLIIASTALGVLLEFIQHYFIPYRDFDGLDIIADSTGSIVMAALLVVTEKNDSQ
jgi:hypothetical protein